VDAVLDDRLEIVLRGRLREKDSGGDARCVIGERRIRRELDKDRRTVNGRPVLRLPRKRFRQIGRSPAVIGVEKNDEDLILLDLLAVEVEIRAEKGAEVARTG